MVAVEIYIISGVPHLPAAALVSSAAKLGLPKFNKTYGVLKHRPEEFRYDDWSAACFYSMKLEIYVDKSRVYLQLFKAVTTCVLRPCLSSQHPRVLPLFWPSIWSTSTLSSRLKWLASTYFFFKDFWWCIVILRSGLGFFKFSSTPSLNLRHKNLW